MTGNSALGAVVLAVAGILPATVLVAFAGLLCLLALPLGAGRRRYALDCLDGSVRLGAAVVGARARPRRTA